MSTNDPQADPTEPAYLGLGSRLTSPPSTDMALAAFGAELDAADVLHPELTYVDVAHVTALASAAIITPGDARDLVAALREIGSIPATKIDWDPMIGDVYNNRDALLRDRVGDTVATLATGRARREATTVAWLIACRRRLLNLFDSSAQLGAALTEVARENRHTLMSDFTYLQHAHPTTLAHYLLGFAYPVSRDCLPLLDAIDAINTSPAGSGSVNGSRFPTDRRVMADLMGFDGLRTHTRDAMWAPDTALVQASAALSIATTTDRLAEELQIWATSEFGYIDLDDAHCRTSVIMPQKKNPYALSHIRGEARRTVGEAATVATTQLSATGQPDHRTVVYHTIPRMLERLTLSTRLLADVVARMRINVAALDAASRSGYAYSTDLCDHLTITFGTSNRDAHRVVGMAVRRAMADGERPVSSRDLSEAATELSLTIGSISDAELDQLRDPANLVALRITEGGAGPKSMDAMFAELDSTWADLSARRSAHPAAGFESEFHGRVDHILAHIDPITNH